jgi:hypothetical protein
LIKSSEDNPSIETNSNLKVQFSKLAPTNLFLNFDPKKGKGTENDGNEFRRRQVIDWQRQQALGVAQGFSVMGLIMGCVIRDSGYLGSPAPASRIPNQVRGFRFQALNFGIRRNI